MYGIPEKYKKEIIINKENFIPKYESSQNKRKIRESLKKVKLKYQIDEDIPNLENEDYNIQVIMLIEVKLKSLKHIEYINQVFQELIKSYVVIKYIYEDRVFLGYGYKRLNKHDSNEIILEDSFVTEDYQEVFLFDSYILYEKYLSFNNIKNKNNKLEFYLENMVKSYLISNRKYFKDHKKILEANIFYSLKLTLKLYKLLKEIIFINIKLEDKKTTSEKVELNKRLASLNKNLEGLIDGKY